MDQVREIVEAEEAVMQKETKVVQDYADECQADLASVIPAIQLAIDSLNTLNKKDISELRVFLRPPALVTLVMSAVCTLLGTKPDWATAKQVNFCLFKKKTYSEYTHVAHKRVQYLYNK